MRAAPYRQLEPPDGGPEPPRFELDEVAWALLAMAAFAAIRIARAIYCEETLNQNIVLAVVVLVVALGGAAFAARRR